MQKNILDQKKVWSKNHHSNIVTFWFGSNHSIRSMVPRRYATDTLNSQWLITLSWTRNIDVTSFWSPFTPLFNWTEHFKRKYCICVCLFSICVYCHQMHAYIHTDCDPLFFQCESFSLSFCPLQEWRIHASNSGVIGDSVHYIEFSSRTTITITIDNAHQCYVTAALQ